MKTLRSLPLLALLCLGTELSAQDREENPKILARRTPTVEVVERVKPAVVSITTKTRVETFLGITEQESSGTGVVIWEDGYIITNYHVVKGASSISVRFDQEDDARLYPAELLSQDRSEDLALLKIDSDRPFPVIPMSEDPPLLGEDVIAIGNALGQSHTVSKGIISGLRRKLTVEKENLIFNNLLQTDAAINHGNSGGPLIDANGELVGINTAIIDFAQSVGYAIPVARVRDVLANNLLSSRKAKAYLGYEIDEQTFNVVEVYPGSPAAKAGIREGDRVLGINGKEVKSKEEYGLLAVSIQPHDLVSIRVQQGRRQRELTVRPGSMIEGIIHRRLGLEIEIVNMDRIGQHLRITDVDPEGPGGRISLKPGDVIAAVMPEGLRYPRRVSVPSSLALILNNVPAGSRMAIEVYRDRNDDRAYDLAAEKLSGTLILR